MANMAIANIGDAYMQLGEYKKAAEYYKKAAASKVNDFSTPMFLMKNGLALEKAGDYSANRLKKTFPLQRRPGI